MSARCHISSLQSQGEVVVLCWRFAAWEWECNHIMCLADVHVLSVCIYIYMKTFGNYRSSMVWYPGTVASSLRQYRSLSACVCLCRSVEYGRIWRSLSYDSCSLSSCASAWQHRPADKRKWRGRSSNTGRCLLVRVGYFSILIIHYCILLFSFRHVYSFVFVL